MIVIIGGTGTLGSETARQLLAKGHEVRVMTRDPSKADKLKKLGAEIVSGDLRDTESLGRAVAKADTVIAAAHAMVGRGKESSAAIDGAGHRALIDAAKKARVGHFIYTSVAGASLDHPVDFWRTKAAVEEYLRKSRLDYTIIRPTAFMQLHAYELIGKAVLSGRRVVLFGAGKNPRNFVAAEDAAQLLVLAAEAGWLRGQTLEIGGPENLTSSQVVSAFEKIGRAKAKVTHVPLAVARVMSRVFLPIHSGVSRVMSGIVVGETTDQRWDPTTHDLPIKLTSLEEWAMRYV
ncbi:MAG: SDR family oxidoreductase [Gemmatimonadales bacterium]